MQLAHRVILVEIDVLILDSAPEPFAEDVVEGATTTDHVDPAVSCAQAVKTSARNRAPGDLLKNALVLGLAKRSPRLLKLKHDKVVSNDGINFSVRPGFRHEM